MKRNRATSNPPNGAHKRLRQTTIKEMFSRRLYGLPNDILLKFFENNSDFELLNLSQCSKKLCSVAKGVFSQRYINNPFQIAFNEKSSTDGEVELETFGKYLASFGAEIRNIKVDCSCLLLSDHWVIQLICMCKNLEKLTILNRRHTTNPFDITWAASATIEDLSFEDFIMFPGQWSRVQIPNLKKMKFNNVSSIIHRTA